MDITGDFNHLSLILAHEGKKYFPKKQNIKVPPSVENNISNRKNHSQKLSHQANSVLKIWDTENVDRLTKKLPDLPDKKPLLINIPAELLDLDYLRSTFGFELVCEYDDGVVIVATEPENLQKGLQKIVDFANEVRGTGKVAYINDIIIEETKEQRLSRILSDELLLNWDHIVQTKSDTITIEISVECQGLTRVGDKPTQKKDEDLIRFQNRLKKWEERQYQAYAEWDEICRQRESEIENFIMNYDGVIKEIIDYVDDISVQDSFEMKISITHEGLVDFALNYPYVFEIKHPDNLDDLFFSNSEAGLMDSVLELLPPTDESPTVCIIDSGIQEGHAYLEKAIRSDLSTCYVPNCDTVNDEVENGGHGTRVAGAVLYPLGITGLGESQYRLPCFIANAKILDKDCKLPSTILPAKTIGTIIKKYSIENGIRIFNHSIASAIPCQNKYMSSWAATIDNASYEKDVLFIQASGNIKTTSTNPFRLGITQHVEAGRIYPDYLLQNSCRIPNPAQSMQALTVGSIIINDYEDNDWTSFAGRGAIASYSCTGGGLWGAIKPEVVEYGGDLVVNKNNNTYRTFSSTCPELLRVSPPAYAKDDIGTSYTAPKVANIAAQLQQLLPNESTLLYKALIVQSARWTSWAESIPDNKKADVLRFIGYGLPDLERALTNNENRITYISSGTRSIQAGYIHIYKVVVPQSIRNLNKSVRIDVTLSFSAKPRRTRKGFKGYFATWVDWTSSKLNEDALSFAERILVNDDEFETQNNTDTEDPDGDGIKWTIGTRNNWGKIKGVNRNQSSTQKDWTVMTAYQLPEEFCIAVTGHKGWSRNGEYSANYAICVSFEAINNDMEIYQTFADIEVPVESEIEMEIEVEND